ncbi:unnamed protein product [Acanthoscelides obtectus]|uniref:Nuclease HARBI1 n=1 Tax=Acanthoscelides obtectus TaxID=200917 RepID=A0A9P0KGE0_ACAOB|nr:unnamed protein product [Acanthoscelides obtectus]CAK1648199.1 Putative nuclease HARBI1 [Acanthoscelides obtectus]
MIRDANIIKYHDALVKVMMFHGTGGVKYCKWGVGLCLESIVGTSMVQVMAEASYQEPEDFQVAHKPTNDANDKKMFCLLELGVSQATVSRTVDRVVNSIVAQSNEWIKFPTTNHELMEAKRIWQSMYKFPTAIGVIDCTHIGILKPNRHRDEHINRKPLVMPERCSQILMSVGLDQCMIPEYEEISRLDHNQ